MFQIQEIIVYSRSTINACSLLSHEWWVSLIKFMVGPTIHVRGGSAFMVLREYLIIFLQIQYENAIAYGREELLYVACLKVMKP